MQKTGKKIPKPAEGSGIYQNHQLSDFPSPASKLLAEADRVIATFPSMMTRKSKHQAQGQVLRLFLSALAAGRTGQAV